MPSRVQLEALLAEDPTDQFLRYGLAMEFDKEGNHERSLSLLAELQNDQPVYVPAFLMAGQQLTRLDRIDEARSVYRRGIAVADEACEAHAAGEMREFLMNLGRLGE